MAVQEQTFEAVWPALSGRLTRVLQRRRVPDECVDDVVQETGLRLLRNWDKVDHSTLWSFTITVAGNIIKDDMRRRVRDERFAESVASNNYVDIEERAIARVELWKTHRAIDALSATQRTALLSEVYGFENTTNLSRGAVKMTRMRARRRLRLALGRASGLVALTGHRLRRSLFGDLRPGFSEGATQTVAAALLIAAGLDLVMLGGGVFRSQVSGETGRVSDSASFAISAVGLRDAATGTSNAGSDSFLRATWVGAPHSTTSDDEVIRHSESVGTDGASGSFGSSVLGQRAEIQLAADREQGECEGDDGTRNPTPEGCVGTFSVKALLHHNGKSYGGHVSSNGDVTVVSPWNLPGN